MAEKILRDLKIKDYMAKVTNLEGEIEERPRILWRDFTGEKNQFNDDRSFTIILEDPLYNALLEDGWPVRVTVPKRDDQYPLNVLTVKVGFKVPPKIIVIQGDRKMRIDESNIEMLNYAHIIDAKMVIRPREWEVGGKSGVKAYLKEMWVTVQEDEFEEMYRDIPYVE